VKNGLWGLILCGILGAGSALGAQPPAGLELSPVLLERAPVLRGDLSDPAWEKAKLPEGVWKTYNPLRGDAFPQKTDVYLAYDAEHLYLGFRCHDAEPDKIKASLAKRDDMFSDDWVGFSLDTFGTHHSALHFFINPLGIQGDALDSVNGQEDPSPDWVWESHAMRQPDGYTVEVSIPLKSIRFQSGNDVRMGILFWRRIARLGISGSWPAMPSGQWVYQNHMPMRFASLAAPLRLEVLPSVTYSRNEVQTAPGQWDRTSKTSLGIGMKVGLTSSVTADLTYKPDFSQVESDAFQSEVNQRYPIFYSEKRPFFMESMGIFSLAGTNGDANMQVPVHTRRIADPLWGAKITGDTGPVSFGVLASADRSPGDAWVGDTNPDLGKRAAFTIGRALYGFGKASYVGAIYSGREFNGTYNRVGGMDFVYNPDGTHTLSGNVLQTWSTAPGAAGPQEGEGHLLSYSYSTRPLNIQFTSEHYGRDFRMDTAFYNRTGIDQANLYIGPNYYPKVAWAPWLQMINPFAYGILIKDNVTWLTDYTGLLAVRFNTDGGGQLRLDLQRIREGWKGDLLTKTVYRVMGSVWATKWLNLGGTARYARDIYYDAPVPFQGPTSTLALNTILQPSDELRLTLDVTHIRMKDPVTAQEVFYSRVFNSQLTYQFNSFFFLRATCRTDTFTRKMLTDYLASFTYIPGTVIFLGYGQVFEKTEWQDDQWQPRGNRYEPTQRGLFFKVSYLWRN
jgi:hypothetical protein